MLSRVLPSLLGAILQKWPHFKNIEGTLYISLNEKLLQRWEGSIACLHLKTQLKNVIVPSEIILESCSAKIKRGGVLKAVFIQINLNSWKKKKSHLSVKSIERHKLSRSYESTPFEFID